MIKLRSVINIAKSSRILKIIFSYIKLIKTYLIRLYTIKNLKKYVHVDGAEIELLEGRDLIVRELLRTGNYHPVHDPILNVHYIMKEDEKKDFALKVQHSGKEFIIPFIVHNGRLVLLINYMSIPEEIFLLSVYKLARKFMWAKSIETQRNYNNYNIPFIKKEELDSYVIDLSQGYDSYFNSLGSNTRFNIRYYYKKMKKDFFNVEIEIYEKGTLSLDLFNKFIKFVSRKYDPSYWLPFTKPKTFEVFKDNVLTSILRVDNEIAALNIYYSVNHQLIFIGTSYNEMFKKYSPGFILTAKTAEITQNSYKSVILGLGDFGYKNRLANRVDKVYIYKL
jgi:hypothetical protein